MLDKELPENPLPMFKLWMDLAWEQGQTPNPNAMIVSSIDVSGPQVRPSARVVLLKDFNQAHGFIVFYTNYDSRKGQELLSHQRASAVLFWDHVGRQVRIEGPAVKSPESESDAYFCNRPRPSQIGAWTSEQSQALDSRQQLMNQRDTQQARFKLDEQIPRPPHWGGFRIWIEQIELWNNGEHRLHDRAVWHRQLPKNELLVSDKLETKDISRQWTVQRLQP